MEKLFTAFDAWLGGSFEILMYLGKVEELYARNCISALWALPHLRGCWRDQSVEPKECTRLDPAKLDVEENRILYGIAELPNGCFCPCSSYELTDDNGSWVYFGVPLGSLGRCYPIGAYPFEDGSDLFWLDPVSKWLASIGHGVHAVNPFKAAITGFLTTREVDEVLRIIAQDIPAERWNGYLRPEGNELRWYPP